MLNVGRHLFRADCYGVGDWFSGVTVVLISCQVQSGGGVVNDEGHLTNLLGLHVSLVSVSCLRTNHVQFNEHMLYKKILRLYFINP